MIDTLAYQFVAGHSPMPNTVKAIGDAIYIWQHNQPVGLGYLPWDGEREEGPLPVIIGNMIGMTYPETLTGYEIEFRDGSHLEYDAETGEVKLYYHLQPE